MANRQAEKTDVTTADPQRVTVDPFEGIAFDSLVLRLAQQTIGPFLAHKGDCLEACTCGLRAAIEDLKRRELMAQRYGVDAS